MPMTKRWIGWVVIAAALGGGCMRGSGPAPCGEVAELLASFELGNYAEPEDRAPVVARFRAACAQARVTVREESCLQEARTVAAAARCVPRVALSTAPHP